MAAIAPSFFERDWWSSCDYPERIMDQYFGMRLNEADLINPTLCGIHWVRPRIKTNIESSGLSEVKNDEKQFTVSLGMKQFRPEEIEVKIVDNYVIVQGVHEERSEESGFCSRNFSRCYALPIGCDAETVTSSFSLDGNLIIVASKKPIEEQSVEKRNISIIEDESKVVSDV
ncbi:protein lethal(2)essential for life [Nephila pilipes]|uniref:Protein lethal(2)essential for life n=1 Tax=Nephila pilipes TaxID=299642 RepID=A0A8X6P995_NEPPI|nr:protein lethal(2)essential for life [Nephila pilipes]